MEKIREILIVALFIALFLPFSSHAQTWVTPSGAVVDDNGKLILGPVIHKPDPLVAYKANPGKFVLTIDSKGCTSVYSHPPGTMKGKIVYVSCPTK